MWLPFAVFVGVLAVVLGAYYGLIVRQEQAFFDRLAPRTKKPGRQRSGRPARGVVKAETRQSAVEPINQMLEYFSPMTVPIRDLIEQSGSQMTVSVFLLISACSGLGAYLVIMRVTGFALAGLAAAAAMAATVPWAIVSWMRNRRLLRFEEKFPEAIDLVARALRAGHALPTGLSMVADEMPAPIGTEFRTLFEEQNFGLTLPDALRNFAGRVPVLDARFFVTAVLTQRETGGNLAEVLDNLSSVIRDRFRVKRQVRVISTHGRMSGYVLAALPPTLAMVIFIMSPAHLGILLHDPLGVRLIVIGLALQVIGTLAIRRIVQIEF